MKEKFDQASFEAMEDRHKEEKESFIDSAHGEAITMNKLIDTANELGLSGEVKEAFVHGKIRYDDKNNYIRPMQGVTENQIIEFIKQIPSLDSYCACGSGTMSQKLLEAIIEKNSRVDLTDIYVIEDGDKWIEEAEKLSDGQCNHAFKKVNDQN